MAITPFKVIQGHRVWYQSKAHMRLSITLVINTGGLKMQDLKRGTKKMKDMKMQELKMKDHMQKQDRKWKTSVYWVNYHNRELF